MEYADPIKLWNGELVHGTVTAHTDECLKVTLRSGAIVTLDLDSPDYWPDGEHRDRRPPLSPDGEFVAIRETMATPDEELAPLLRVSAATARLAKNDPELAAALGEVRRILMERLRERAA
jgi:hypothetical protein